MFLFHSHSVDMRKLKNGLRRYVLENVYPKLGLPETPFKILLPMWGSKSVVCELHLETGQVFFVRLYRPWQRSEAERQKNFNALFLKAGVRVPGILDYGDKPKRYYSIVMVEEFLQGRPLTPDEFKEDRTRLLAEQMARMHGSRMPHWGDPPTPNNRGSLFKHLYRRVSNRLSRTLQHGILDIRKELPEIMEKMKSWSDLFHTLTNYNLTHDKVHSKNILLLSDETLAFVDFETAYYSFLGKDILTIHHCYCGDDQVRIDAFDRDYFHLMLPEEAKIFREAYPFYHSWYHLSRCAENCNAARKCLRANEPYGEVYKERACEQWTLARESVNDSKGRHSLQDR